MNLRRFQVASFRLQVALAIAALVIGLAGTVTIVLGHMLSERLHDEAASALESVAGNAARQLGAGLVERLTLVTTLAASESLWRDGLQSPLVQATLTREQAIRADLAWIGVAATDGRVKAATGSLLVGADVSARPWYPQGLEAPTIGDVHTAKLLATLLSAAADGEPRRFVDFSAPIRFGDRTLGVLAIHGSWEWSRRVAESLLPPDAGRRGLAVFIFDRQGAMIHSPAGAAARPPAAAASATLQWLVDADRRASGSAAPAEVRAWNDGAAYLTAVATLPALGPRADLGWRVVARLPVDAAYADARTAVGKVFAVSLVAAVLAALLAWRVAGQLSEPLSAIARAADAVERGVSGARIPVYRGNRELTRLSEALAAMTGRLLTSNEALESRVAARTAELEAANRDLERLARFDPLTGLLNRRGFEEQMRMAIASARRGNRPLTVVMVDIDHFKQVNDRHGHDAGDAVLRVLAQRFTARLRESDVVGRIGGEEFAALLPDTDYDGARHLLNDLVDRVASAPMPIVGVVTISCGVARVRPTDDGASALKRADLALYRAKHTGRNRAEFQTTGFDPALADFEHVAEAESSF